MDLAPSEPAQPEARRPGRYRTARGLAVAVAGLFAGHWLVYRILAPNALQRALLLAETGHAYLPPAASAAAGLAAVAAAATFFLGFRRGTAARRAAGQNSQHYPLVQAILLPAIAQAVAFCLLEALERVLAGAPLNGLLGPLLPIGVGLQLAVGALGGLLLFGLDRAGEHAGRHLTRRDAVLRRARPAAPVIASRSPLLRRFRAEPFGIRGPPAVARTSA